jgi:hypothetical protein
VALNQRERSAHDCMTVSCSRSRRKKKRCQPLWVFLSHLCVVDAPRPAPQLAQVIVLAYFGSGAPVQALRLGHFC